MSTSESETEIDRVMKIFKSSGTMFQILDVDPNTATVKTVKAQYNKLALLTHPDKVKLPNASDAFDLVNRAYKLLGNEILLKRAVQGEIARSSNANNSGAAAAGGGANDNNNNNNNDNNNNNVSREEAEEQLKEKLREEYMAALRAHEERDRRRKREQTDLAEKEQEKQEIVASAEAWKKFRAGRM